jgi:predicted sulfurtransferase
MSKFTNIAAYRFARLENLHELRTSLKQSCLSLGLKGTILLSPEGINVFVAGSLPAVDQLLDLMRAIPGLADLTAKYSQSDQQPFNRMLVKLKKEIIAFGIEGIDPARKTAPKLPPRELKKWLDEGRPITLLDTRNDYEVKLGTFKGALHPEIDHFREFPDAVRRLPDSLKDEPIVMFCTGGIRCEKAGPFMEREGFRNIFQLDGGILKYFEECGNAHYDGECFVFDQRVGVDGDLRETGSVICFNCQMPLTVEEQRHPHYVREESCPHCYQTRSTRQEILIKQRQDALSRASHPPASFAAADRPSPDPREDEV